MPTLSENITQVINDFDSIKTAIENTGVEVGNVPTSEYSEYVTKAYDKGVTDSKQAEYDRFWDMYQGYGTRTDYTCAFFLWNSANFKPKYNITVTAGYKMFYKFNQGGSPIDLVDRFTELGITFTTKSNEMNYLFYNANISRVGTISYLSSAHSENTFNGASNLVTIEGLIFKSNGEQLFFGTFNNCTKLANINDIQGKIGRTVTFAQSPLTVETAKRVINALVNYAGTSSELTYQLTLNNTVWEALDEAETPPSGETWKDYVGSLGWKYA